MTWVSHQPTERTMNEIKRMAWIWASGSSTSRRRTRRAGSSSASGCGARACSPIWRSCCCSPRRSPTRTAGCSSSIRAIRTVARRRVRSGRPRHRGASIGRPSFDGPRMDFGGDGRMIGSLTPVAEPQVCLPVGNDRRSGRRRNGSAPIAADSRDQQVRQRFERRQIDMGRSRLRTVEQLCRSNIHNGTSSRGPRARPARRQWAVPWVSAA